MTTTVLPAAPTEHYGPIADLLTRVGPERVEEYELHEHDERVLPGKLVRRWVALSGEAVVGTAFAIRYPSEPEGLFNVLVAVEPAAERAGVGGRLARCVEDVVVAEKASLLRAELREGSPRAAAFAQARGFAEVRRSLRSALDLRTADESAAVAALERIEAAGIRLRSFADVQQDDVALRALYAINRTASVDDPATLDGTFPPFETWRRVVVESAGFQPEGQFVAEAGGRFVGLAAVALDGDGSATSVITGVDRAYRRRGIALALKLLTIRHARANGATWLVTENDARNEPMLAINRGLGYEPRPGYVVLERSLAP